MNSAHREIPDDPKLMREMLLSVLAENHKQRGEIDSLHAQIQQMLRRLYGPRSERYDPNQLTLLDVGASQPRDEQSAVTAPANDEPKPARRRGHRQSRSERYKNLPRTVIKHPVPPEERVCACCNEPKTKVGEEVTEEIEYTPASIVINQHVREKLACKTCECGVTIAPAPVRAIEKGLPGPGMLAHVVVSKIDDHIPLTRQAKMLQRQGVPAARSTLCDWIAAAAAVLECIYDAMKREVLASHIIWTDDTPVPVLDRSRDSTRTARLWVYIGDAAHPFTVYDYTTSRKRDGPAEFLRDFVGFLQADAYGGYDGIYAGRLVIEVACWVHARRYFFKAKDSDPWRAEVALAWIRELYKVERAAKDSGLDFAARRGLRREKCVEILRRFHEWLGQERPHVLPKSPMGTAFGYALSNWAALERYCEDGELEPDNNRSEREIRRVAVGRKNWCFLGSDVGGRTAAILMSICASCYQHGVNPWAYIRDVLIRVSIEPHSRLRELLPDRWKLAHPAAAATSPAALPAAAE